MNAETALQTKTEAFAMPHDLYHYEPLTCPTFTCLTNLSPYCRPDDCWECCDQVDYACPSNICCVCFHSTMYGIRYLCFLCHKVFHEACRNNLELASSTGRWMCGDCKYQEKRFSSTFVPRIQNVVTVANDKNFHMPFMKWEKCDEADCRSDKFDLVGCRSAILNDDRNALSPTPNKPIDVVPTVQQTAANIKDEIVDKVAESILQKINNTRRKTICTSVPPNHFGPIPGIPVGTCWKYRLQVSESGIHRPLVAGIAGRFNEGAFSIVLSGVYPEDEDFGFEFYYSGCGGRDKTAYPMLKVQTVDQILTRLNRALALSCNAPFNDQCGAESIDWQGGKPVRVVRNFKLRKHSIYAPAEGNRYDGIYKVVKYFPVIGQTGLVVWRYLLRRDDPEPAPWTEEGKRIIEEKNLRVIYPCGYKTEPINIKRKKVECPPSKKIAYNLNKVNEVIKMEPYDPSYQQLHLPSNSMPTSDYFHEEVDIKPDGTLLRANVPQPPSSYNSTYSWYRPPSDIPVAVDASVQSAPSLQLHVSFVRSLNPNKSSDYISSSAQYCSTAVSNPSSIAAPNVPAPTSNGPNLLIPANDVPSIPAPVSDISTSVNNVPSIFAHNNNVPTIPAFTNNAPSILQPVNNSYFGVITVKEEHYQLSASVEKFIDLDTANETLWVYCRTYLGKSRKEFLDAVRLMFLCRYCHKLVDRPITTPCNHNICLKCTMKHFSKGQFSCPECFFYLGPTFNLIENKNLASALKNVFSGYDV